MDISGVYQILNLVTGKFYIGSSVRMNKRWKEHKRCLNESKHPNLHLQSSWDIYSEAYFEFIIIELCEKDQLITREQFWMNSLNSVTPHGYNICPTAFSRLGTKHTKETLSKLKLKVISEEHKLKISKHFKGTKHTEETKLKIKNGNLGKKNTQEAKERMKLAWLKRKGFDNIISTPMMLGETGWI